MKIPMTRICRSQKVKEIVVARQVKKMIVLLGDSEAAPEILLLWYFLVKIYNA